ncbi:hypothetical protein SAMN05421812_102471 [Asanoa hainanensis]|uniref:MYXO-CTERM domain-containing protein n=1 Tax=Asanoa hainanensis TaxID=560556 RepID=A0A239INI6_9ACTN|nr:DUF4229 domain-containing protein [Asanoa hainanensis]SNS94808.1 hypothetical protein SAMN05421812_102471 [Asanoa hainanensis]
MGSKQRWSIRPGSVALTRAQWVTAAICVAVAVVGGLALGLAVSAAAAGILVGIAGLALAMVVAFGRRPRP